MKALKMTAVATTMAAGIAMSGCTTNPQTGQQEISKAAIGAIVGAGAGALIDKDKRGRGAAIGAVLGGGIGYYMDQQEKKLREQMRGTGVDIKRDPATGALDLVMPGNITFDFNSSNVKSQFTDTLNDVAGVLKEYDKTSIEVKGYTDNVGSQSYNKRLSKQRAVSVASYLAGQGVSGSRLISQGYGMSNPIASNNTDAGRAENRRVEIRINAPQSL